MKHPILTLALLAAGAAACASQPVPTARVASAEAAIRAANEIGAQNIPEAEMHLRVARDELGKARKLLKDGENEDATWLLARAESDAELAVAMAREARERAEAQAAINRVHSMSPRNQ